MRSWWISLRYDFRRVRFVQTKRPQVVKDPEGRQGETRDGRADQGEIGTEELSHATSVDLRPPPAMTETS
jgi:hypothetical protein